MNRPELLAIYLNDHLAGSVGGVETARRARGSNEGSEFGEPLARLCEEIESDREALEAAMDELGIGKSRLEPRDRVDRREARPTEAKRAVPRLLAPQPGARAGTAGARDHRQSASRTLLEELVGERSEADFAGLGARAEEQRRGGRGVAASRRPVALTRS